MQHLISWKQYIMLSVLAFFIYYVFIVLRFYRNELLHIKLSSRPVSNQVNSAEDSANTVTKNFHGKQANEDSLSEKVNDFNEELVVLLKQSVAENAKHVELVESLSKLTVKYKSLKGSLYQPGLIAMTDEAAEKICKLHLTEKELDSIWT